MADFAFTARFTAAKPPPTERQLRQAATLAMLSVLSEAQADARAHMPRDTGASAESIEITEPAWHGEVLTSGLEAGGPAAPQATWHEFGTGVRNIRAGGRWHFIVIVPRTKKVLRWIGADGVPVFARVVTQAGHWPRLTVRKALEGAWENFGERFAKELAAAR